MNLKIHHQNKGIYFVKLVGGKSRKSMSKTISDQDKKKLNQAMSKVWALIGGRTTGKTISDQEMTKIQKALQGKGKGKGNAKGGKVVKKRASGGSVKKRK